MSFMLYLEWIVTNYQLNSIILDDTRLVSESIEKLSDQLIKHISDSFSTDNYPDTFGRYSLEILNRIAVTLIVLKAANLILCVTFAYQNSEDIGIMLDSLLSGAALQVYTLCTREVTLSHHSRRFIILTFFDFDG
ncbi:hypothetical protein AVEN_160875-1 [Araneus ventricosus]|uniref:Uncharacterized protein n=1 Tax=Araneus ventricosus TaxID=182803 RepID=A0A4Y2F4H6_ARAVE|nr:hypothetical protein AVEN_196548-1 [Araneus ventricosus]GBM36264.1 hypothetical protein AVEN_251812-1 [Araneus ventricosus]GBM36278.1 hypothetical protein AVEN_57713-1 [Araneus ventricosus]GBM36333.1 hypothetical protein AVEN_160875-1 [Araneus ventricosus]